MPLLQENRDRNDVAPTGDKDSDHILRWALEAYSSTRDEHEQDWCQDHYIYYKYIKNYMETRVDPDDYHSNVGVGLAWPIMKVVSAKLMAPWQAGDRLIDAIPLEEVGRKRSDQIAAWINHQFINGIPRMYSKMELTKESAISMGRGIVKHRMAKPTPTKILKRLPVEVAGQVLESKLQWVDSEPESKFMFDYVDPFNFWWSGTSRWYEEADCTFERSYMTFSAVQRMIASGEWEHFEISAGDAVGYDQYTLKRLQLEGGYGDNVRAGDGTHKPHQLVEIQGWVETRKKRNGYPVFEKRLVQFLDKKHLVKNELLATWDANPSYIVYEPSLDCCGNRPIGLVEPVEQILLAINDFTNIGFDNARKIVESSFVIDPEMTDQDELYLGPGEQNWIQNPRASVAPLEMKDLPQSFVWFIGFFKDLLQSNTGISDYMGGLNTQDTQRLTKTAKGMEMMTNLASSRIAPFISKMDYELYRPMARAMHQTARQRMTKPQRIRLPGNPSAPFATVLPEHLDAELEYAFNVKALDQATGRRRQDFLEMTDRLIGLQTAGGFQAAGVEIDAVEVARMMMEEFDHGGNVDNLIKQVNQLPVGDAPPAAPQPPQGAPPQGPPP